MKTKALSSKWLILLAVALVLVATVFAFTLNTDAAETQPAGMTFTKNDFYQLSQHVSPNGPVTLETEIYIPVAERGKRHTLVSNYDNGITGGTWKFEVYTTNKIRVWGANGVDIEPNYVITDDMGTDDSNPKFVKIAVTVDTTTASNNVKLYVNGVLKATATDADIAKKDMYNTANSNLLSIGGDLELGRTPTNTYPFSGYMKNIALYKGARAISTQNHFDTNDSNMIFGYDLTNVKNGFLEDLSGNGIYAINRKGEGKSFTAGELYMMSKGVAQASGSQITFECELYIPEAYRTGSKTGERVGVLVSNYIGTADQAWAFEIMGGGKVRVFSNLTNGGDITIEYDIRQHMGGTDADPEYADIAVTIDTSTGAIQLYVDGTCRKTFTNEKANRADVYTVNRELCIGGDKRSGNSQYFKGKIRSVAMFSGIRTMDQIRKDQCAAFCDTSDPNLIFAHNLMEAYDGFIEDKSANKNHANSNKWTATEGTTFTNTTTNQPTVVKPYAEAPYTYEAVVYAPLSCAGVKGDGSDSPGTIIANYPNNSGDSFLFQVRGAGKPSIYIFEQGKTVVNHQFNYDIRRNGFVHLAITHEYDAATNSTVFKCYVDGELVDSLTIANYKFEMDMTAFAKTRNYTIGHCGRQCLNWKGNIKSIALHNKPLSAAEIKASYENGVNAKADDVIAYYDLTAVKDGFIEDESGNGYHANYPEWKATEGRSFTETEDYLYMAKDLEEMPYSYEALIYAPLGSDTDRPGPILANYPNNFGDSIMFEIRAGGKPALYLYDDGSAETIEFSYDIRRNAYAHLVITHENNASNSVFKCYVNGELVETKTINRVFTFDLDTINATGPINLGHCDNRAWMYYKGNIKNAAMHNKVLSADEVKASYENGVNANKNSLIAYYDLTGPDATTTAIKDMSGNGYDLRSLFFEKNFETEPYDYSFAVVGDTQFMVYQDAVYGTDYTEYIYDWIVKNYDSKKMKYVFGLGDIIDNGKWPDGTGSKNAEWAYAKELITSTLGANNIPYSLIGGNHDFMRPWDTGFNSTFGNEPTFTDNITGYYQGTEVYNYYINFEVGETQYMLLALEYGANDDILAWANNIVAANKHRRVIITTHGYMYNDGTWLDENKWDAPRPAGTTDANILKYNNADEMWDKFVSQHGNIVMVLSGHDPCSNIVMREDVGVHGNTVQQFLIDPQGMDKTYSYQTGMVAMLYFRNGGKDVSVEYVSTYRTAKNNNKEVLFGRSQFDFEIKEATNKEAPKGEINVWLIGGQSNGVGYANGLSAEQLADPRYTNGFENILYYGYGEKWQSSFAPVKLGYGNTANASGAELGIAAALGNTGEMNAIIKYAQGATALYPVTDSWAAQNFGTWTSPSYINAKNIETSGNLTGNLYVNFINTVESAITELRRMGYTPVIKGMWWMQGEEETYNGGADVYAELLRYLVNDIRVDLGAITGADMSKMPFVIGQIYTEKRPELQDGISKVQAQQQAYVASDPYSALVSPKGCSEYDTQDQWHFNAATQSYLGKSFVTKANAINGECIVEIVGNNVIAKGGGLYKNGENVNITFTLADTYELESLTLKVGSGAATSILDKLNNMSYSFVCNGENTTFTAVAKSAYDIETDYGTVPKDEIDYPVVLFTKEGAYLGAYNNVTEAANKAMENPSGDYVILLRADVSQTDGAFISNLTGSITLDLGGYTLTKAGNPYILEGYYGGGAFAGGKLMVKNGYLVNQGWSAFFCYNYGGSLSGNVSFSFEFDNVSFKSNFTAETGKNVIFETWEDGVGVTQNQITADIVFNDCIFDYTGSATDEIMLSLQARGGLGAVFNVTINGGEIIADRTIGIAELATMDNGDSVKFGKGAKGYTVCTLAKDVEISGEQLDAVSGAKLSYSNGTLNGSNYSFTLGEDVVTAYGTIPYKYTDAQAYPFVVFRNGNLVHASAYFGRDNSESALSYGKTNGTVILMRRDFTYTESQYNNLSQTYSITIDLGGYTFTSTDRIVFLAQKKTANNTSLTVKNGTFVLGSQPLMKFSTWNPAVEYPNSAPYTGGNGFDFIFDKINIVLTNGATASNVLTYNAFKTEDPTQFCNLTFNNCTFDLKGSANATVTLFDFSDAHCKAKATVNGGQIITNGIKLVNLSGANAESSLSFAKLNGSYTTISIKSGVAAPSESYIVENGVECIFAKVSENGGYVNYSLYPKVMVGYTVKTSVTLYSNFVYNIYIPKANVKSFTVNGKTVAYTTEKINNVEYYRVEVNLPAPETLNDIKVKVTLNSGSTTVDANWTLNVLSYAKSVLADTKTDNVTKAAKTLVKDMLVYAKAAHTYFKNTADVAAKLSEIATVLNGYNASVPTGTAKKPTDKTYFTDVAVYVGDVPSFRFYPNGNYTKDNFTFKVGGRNVDVTEGTDSNGKKYIEVVMYAYMMLDDVTFTVKSNNKPETYNIFSYLDYAKNTLKDANLVAVVESLMKYSVSAAEYKAAYMAANPNA